MTHFTTSGFRSPHARVALLALTAALGVAGCGGSDASDSGASEAAAVTVVPAAEESGDFIEATAEAAAAEEPAVGDSGDSGGIDLGSIGRDVIVEMHVVMTSDNLERSVASVTARAAALGGGIASSDVRYAAPADDEGQVGGHAVLVVKVPPAEVDRFLAGLEDSGDVLSMNQSAQDVTEQLVDLDVRIENARTSVATVRDFMTRTTNLTELVALESELTRRQTELEQLEAQKRNLSDRVALATITVEMMPTPALPDAPEEENEGIGDAFRNGWDAFVTVLFGLGFVLAVLAPFIVTGAVIGGVIWWVMRRRTRTEPHTGPLAPPTAPSDTPSDSREEELVS